MQYWRHERIVISQYAPFMRGEIAPPYRPSENYPELCGVPQSRARNTTYDATRELIRRWAGPSNADDPFGEIVHPGMRVAIKPNLVLHTHPEGEHALRATVTDGAVLRVILDYVALALRGDGVIIVAESPIRCTDFGHVVRFTGLDVVLEDIASLWNVDVELIDIRDQAAANAADFESTLRVRSLPGDPRGGVQVDLGAGSAMEPLGAAMSRLRSTAAVGANETGGRHKPGTHVYELSRSVLGADLIISVPKLKTHKKTGITGAMKNFVGANVRKEWLPHHRKGAPTVGGDEYADDVDIRLKMREHAKDLRLQTRFGNWFFRPGVWLYRHTIRGTGLDFMRVRRQSPMVNGGWSGNDTCWRMVHDVFRAAIYANLDGTLAPRPLRLPLTIVDGLVAGEGDGPLRPRPRRAGILAMGFDAPWLDYFLALMMGFEPTKIPMVQQALLRGGPAPLTELSLENIELLCDPPELRERLLSGQAARDQFVPPAGWARHLCDERTYKIALQQQKGASADY